MAKADNALKSARLLLASGDVDGTCNRAYYAMFDAPRAALLAVAPIQAEKARTHSGLIGAFGIHLVKTGKVSIELGRSLNRAQELRTIADYGGNAVEFALAANVVQHAETFVKAMIGIVSNHPIPEA